VQTGLRVTLLLLAVATRATADPTLDPTFGVGGLAPVPLLQLIDRAVALQPDGRIVIAGIVYSALSGTDLAVVRYMPDGSGDTSFGTGGLVVQDTGVAEGRESGLALQPDGKILLAASTGPYFAEAGMIVRFDANGTLDPTFGVGGIVATGPGSIEDLALDGDGNIVVTGSVITSWPSMPTSHVWIGRFDALGVPDSTFGVGGTVHLDRGVNDLATRLLPLPGGGVVVLGATVGTPLVTDPDDFLLLQVDASGALDPAFGAGGVVVQDFGFGTNDAPWSFVRQTDGKLVAVGSAYLPSANLSVVAVARWDADGVPDPLFGIGGINLIGSGNEFGLGAALDAAGRLVVSGTRSLISAFVMRLGTGGVLESESGWPLELNQTTFVGALAVQPDGGIVGLGDTMALRIRPGDCDAFDATPCAHCDPATGVVATGPRTGCATTVRPGRALLKLTDGGRRMAWRWNDGGALAAGDLGDPLGDASSAYDVCVFDESAATPVLALASRAVSNLAPDCAHPPCWRAGTNGKLTYRSTPPNAAGLSSLQMRPGAAGRARVRVKGIDLLGGPATLPSPLPLRVQVQVRGGACVEAVHSAAGMRRNDARRFQGASD